MRHDLAPLRPQRILHVLFSPRMAGSERYCVDLANQQAALGYEVHVAGVPGSLMAQALSPKVRFHGLGLPLFRGLQLQRLMARHSIDIAHGHLSPACKALARAKTNTPKVATLHVGYKPHQHARLDGLICVNQAQSARLDGYGGHARIISNWIPAKDGKPFAESRLRLELGISHDTFLIGSVGRLHSSKGMDVLISAFRACAPASAALVILGEGPQRAELEKLRGGDRRIHLLGFREDVRDALRDMDLFVSPSREESFGLAILEAMSEGLPVLATATEGPREILRGYPIELVEPGSVRALAAGLCHELAKELPDMPINWRKRINYDLKPFAAETGVSSIADFYGLVMNDVRHTARAAALQAIGHLTPV